MGDVVNFDEEKDRKISSPPSVVEELEAKLAYARKKNEKLSQELNQARKESRKIDSVNKFLRIQINELINQVYFLEQHLQNIRRNATELKNKLPKELENEGGQEKS